MATMVRREGLLPLDRGAVARVIEHSARMAGDALRLSADLRRLGDLVSEADHGARIAGRQVIDASDVQRAIDAQQRRADRLRERIHDTIIRGTIMIDSDGEKIGQVNGLSVYVLGEHAFGEPTRITATTRVGDGQIIDVQREVELGGAIHSKGVLILSAFLAARFSTREPHALSASLVFEQTYGTVEGDSASVAELVALMSSLAEVPVRQALAVTGSVNQLGQVQAIGGVNEKIEGFFDICRARGLTGRQGVIIPAANVEHLMLRSDVVAAVAAGHFQVWAVQEVDEVIELLTGLPAGVRDAGGAWPADSINGRIARRLKALTRLRQEQMRRALRGAKGQGEAQ
jgi:lon-related putative ATP-dependent protease